MYSFQLVLLSVLLAVSQAQFVVDISGPNEAFPHFWEACIGSCHATFALRADWREHVQRATAELGFQRVRFHGLFDDDMSVVLPSGEYSFLNVDRAFDWLLFVAHVRPLVEVSFMPELLASNASMTQFHYKGIVSPPRSQGEWSALVKSFAAHLIERYGAVEVSQWLFEVWNEPNLESFWSGTKQQYFELLETTYHALKSVDARIQVGGPATAQTGWLADTVAFAARRGLDLSFISTHLYPSDPVSSKKRDNMKVCFTRARAEVGNGTRLVVTEFNSGLDMPHHDDPFAAAFVIKTVADVHGIVDAISYWDVSDLFEEGGQDPRPFQQQFGVLNVYGVAKPVYRALQLLHRAGNTRLLPKPGQTVGTVDLLATMNATHVVLLLTNYEWVTNPIQPQTVSITLSGVPASWKTPTTATMFMINEASANPAATWRAMGKPVYPTPAQVEAMHAASEMSFVPLPFTHTGTHITFDSITLDPYSVAGVFVKVK